jgi:xanthosine utilization system XapX-like protein
MGGYSVQNKYEIGLLVVFLLSVIFFRDYAPLVMIFVCIPGILIIERVMGEPV